MEGLTLGESESTANRGRPPNKFEAGRWPDAGSGSALLCSFSGHEHFT
jgi:hypothetical protein